MAQRSRSADRVYTHVGGNAVQVREATETILRYFRTVPIPPPPEWGPLTDLTRKYEELGSGMRGHLRSALGRECGPVW